MPFTIVRQDITRMEVDAIVNAANTQLAMGGGVCGAIFRAAGSEELQAACDRLAPIRTGEAVLTPGFRLKAKFIIHAAGPVYRQWDAQESERLLRSAYWQALNLARKHGLESIAFPLISSGIYGYPKEAALRVATDAIRDFLSEYDLQVYLAIFDRDAFVVSRALMGAVESYIDENYVDAHRVQRRALLDVECQAMNAAPPPCAQAAPARTAGELEDRIARMDLPFNAALMKLIDERGKTDAQVYKRANIDRKLFSKIRTGKGYTPGKRTILALAVALELSLLETQDLLRRAGYALSHSQKFDVIVEFFILSGRYDIFEINQVLFQYDQPLLGAGG